jgi:hypothetical protein
MKEVKMFKFSTWWQNKNCLFFALFLQGQAKKNSSESNIRISKWLNARTSIYHFSSQPLNNSICLKQKYENKFRLKYAIHGTEYLLQR